jgi:2-dehydropantoate 2-reductase
LTRGPQKILVAGCGAIGSAFACLLKKAGNTVALLGREWHLRAIRARGLAMDGLWGEHRAEGFVLATDACSIPGHYDLILISVKAHSTTAMVRQVKSFIKPDGVAISLQNGLGNVETLAQTFGASRSLGASILVGAIIPEPGRVTITVQAAPVIIGPLSASNSMVQTHALTELFRQAGIMCEPSDQILAHLWAKVFYNAPLNPLGALLGVHYGALGEQAELKAVMDHIIDEAFAVAVKQGVALSWKSVAEFRALFYSQLLPATFRHQSSMLQDLTRGRKTEIDALNGQIWQYGRSLGIPTPFNEIMTRLIRAREHKTASRSTSS